MLPGKIYLWCPNIFEFKGGIQAYSKFLLRSLKREFPESELKVFLKHDSFISQAEPKEENVTYSFSGKYPQKLRTAVFSLKLFFGAVFSKPDLIISTHLNFSPVQLILKKLFGIPYCVVAHGVDAWGINNALLKKSLISADLILAVSNYTRDRIIKELHLNPEKVKILPNTFDEDRFQIKTYPQYLAERHGLNKNDKIMLTVCRLDASEKYKGYDQVFRCLAKLKDKHPELKYILAGKGSDLSRAVQLTEELGIGEMVIITGQVSDQELPDYYNLSDLFIMPSKGEGFGIVFLEALACGKPCIAGNGDGSADPLQNGELGELADPDDINNLNDKIISILYKTNPNKVLFQPQKLRNSVVKTYGFDSFCSKLAGLLKII